MRAPLLSASGLVVAGFLILPAAPAQAQGYGQTLPRGTYSQTCQNARVDTNGWLSADCRADNGSWRQSQIRAADCRADIANRDGQLVCTAGLGTGPLGQLADALVGGLAGQGNQPLYQDGFRYPQYGQPGYGDPRFDPRFGRDGWGYGRDRQWVPLSERRTWVQNRIEAARRQGLSQSEASSITRGVDDLIRLETQYARDGLTVAERVELDTRFDLLAARARVTGSSGGGWDTGWRAIETRRSDFERAVADAQSRNRITRAEAARLRADFEDLIDAEASYSRNGLDRNEQAELERRYEVLIGRTGGGSNSPGGGWSGPTIADQAYDIDARIESQRRAGRLSRTEAARLGDDLDALVRLEADYRRDGLSRQESDDLTRRLQDLNTRIGGPAIQPPSPTPTGPVAARRNDLLGRIDTAVRNRRISSQEGTRLRNELEELGRMEQDYARDGLSNAERSYLESRLTGLEAFIPR